MLFFLFLAPQDRHVLEVSLVRQGHLCLLTVQIWQGEWGITSFTMSTGSPLQYNSIHVIDLAYWKEYRFYIIIIPLAPGAP